jgi:hypothetical protein
MGKQSRLEKKKQAKKNSSMASQADYHELYQKSVQDTDVELELMVEKYREIRGKEPLSFREDFCGTALLSVAWCQRKSKCTAQGVDLCEQTLDWGKKHNVLPAGKKVAARVELVHGNVLKVHKPKVDLTCAFNFSYSVFKTREQLRRYFKSARKGLNEEGVLMLDIFGGTEAITSTREKRKIEGEPFTFIWEQEKYNPVTNEILCHINFKFTDGSKIEPAFTYDWRLWTIPELHELLLEAGFSKVHVYWEEYQDDEDDEGYLVANGNYIEVNEVENQESWVSYMCAEV